MKVFNKLVRDHIPKVVEADGRTCETLLLQPSEFHSALLDKLAEEVDELRETGDLNELTDVLEVAYGLAELKGWSASDLEQKRLEKKASRGGFAKRLMLISIS